MTAPKSDFGAWFASQQQGVAGSMSASSAAARPSGEGGLFASLSGLLGGGAGSGSAAGAPGGGAAAPGSAQGADVEAGGAGGAGAAASSSAALLSSLSAFLPAGLQPQQGAGEASAAAAAAAASSPGEWTCGLSYGQRLQAFLLLGCGSLSLYFAAFFIFLPLLLLAPSKFATSFTFASLLWLAGFAILRGPRSTLLGLLQRDKLPFTAAYVGSLALTLYATLVSQSYFFVLLAVVVQCSAAVWYGSSYIPGGPAAAGALGRMAISTGRGVVGGLVGGR
jgi:hypothetical protein